MRYKQKTFIPRQTENEGTQRIPLRTRGSEPASSFSLSEKLAERVDVEWLTVDGECARAHLSSSKRNLQLSNASTGRAQPNRYPDFGHGLAPAFPSAAWAHSGLWEFVVRYSGATVPDSHGVPCHLTAVKMDKRSIVFKERTLRTPANKFCQAEISVQFCAGWGEAVGLWFESGSGASDIPETSPVPKPTSAPAARIVFRGTARCSFSRAHCSRFASRGTSGCGEMAATIRSAKWT